MTDAWANWPPPAEELWLVHGSMGAAVSTANDDGAGRAVMLRVAAVRNKNRDESLDATLVLDQDTVVELLAGLLGTGNEAFGRESLQVAMAAHLLKRHTGDEENDRG